MTDEILNYSEPEDDFEQPAVSCEEQANELAADIFIGQQFAEMANTEGWKMLVGTMRTRREQLVACLVGTDPAKWSQIAACQAEIVVIDNLLDKVSGAIAKMHAAHRYKA
jgi:hypothetical protein